MELSFQVRFICVIDIAIADKFEGAEGTGGNTGLSYGRRIC